MSEEYERATRLDDIAHAKRRGFSHSRAVKLAEYGMEIPHNCIVQFTDDDNSGPPNWVHISPFSSSKVLINYLRKEILAGRKIPFVVINGMVVQRLMFDCFVDLNQKEGFGRTSLRHRRSESRDRQVREA